MHRSNQDSNANARSHHDRSVQRSPSRQNVDSTPDAALDSPVAYEAHPLLQLQRQYGNQAVQQMAQQRMQRRSGSSPVIQAKLTLGQVGDRYEQEADRVAKEVVNRISSAPSDTTQRMTPEDEEMVGQRKAIVQRMGPEDEEMVSRNSLLQQQTSSESSEISPDIESAIQRKKGTGTPLPNPLKGSMEQAFGNADFSNVRIHTDAESNQLSTALQAKAFTTGQDIFLGDGEYHPTTQQGQELLAHELTHVIQQTGTIQPKLTTNHPDRSISRRVQIADKLTPITQQDGPNILQRTPLAALGAAEWIAAAGLGFTVAKEAVNQSSGDISWKLDEASGVLLPGGRTDVEKYQEENPNLQVEQKELVVSFWRGTASSKKGGITFGLAFSTDGKGIGNVSARMIETHDWVGWGASCRVDLMPQTFVSTSGRAVIRVTLTNAWVKNLVGIDVSDGVDSEIWHLEGNGTFTRFRNHDYMRVEHRLT